MSCIKKFIDNLLNKKKIEAISFNQGDVIVYTDPNFKKEKLTGLILDKDEKTYKIKWFGYYSDVACQTRDFIESRSRAIITAQT
jgi:hypothetical protein